MGPNVGVPCWTTQRCRTAVLRSQLVLTARSVEPRGARYITLEETRLYPILIPGI